MSNMNAVAEALKARLNAQAAAPDSVEPVAGTGKPAPSAPNAAPPPSQPPVPAAQAVPAAPVAPAPDVAALQRQLADLSASNQALNAQLQAMKVQPPPPIQIQLPPKEQLDAMPQSELAALLAQQIAGHTMAAVQSRVDTLERQQIAPLAANLNDVRKVEAEKALRGRFPRLDMEKYRPAFEAKLVQNRSLSFEDAIRLVADPADLMPADPAMTSAQGVGPAVHMENGVPSRTAAIPVSANKEPTRAELIASANEARVRGDTFMHRELMKQATKVAMGFTG